MRKATSVVVDVGGVSLRAMLKATGENVEIRVDVERNHPAVPGTAQSMFERIVADRGTGRSLGLRFEERFRIRESLIGWLRAAYLVAFTALGYYYILDRALNCVREQIRTPKGDVIKSFSTIVPAASPEERLFGFLEEPAEIQSVIVRMGEQMVFLPEPGDMNFYQRIERLAKPGGPVQCKVKRLSWPTRPVFAMDFTGPYGDRSDAEGRSSNSECRV
jgi:hypothetical protein